VLEGRCWKGRKGSGGREGEWWKGEGAGRVEVLEGSRWKGEGAGRVEVLEGSRWKGAIEGVKIGPKEIYPIAPGFGFSGYKNLPPLQMGD